MEERRSANGNPLYAIRDRNIALRGACPELPHIRVKLLNAVSKGGTYVRTREKPGDGMASVPRINESLSAWKGFAGRSYGTPLTFTAVRTGRDHRPRAPPIAWSLRFVRVGRSRYPAQG